jgi:5'-nucleotidase
MSSPSIKKRLLLTVLLVVALLVSAAPVALAQGPYTLTILHTNDTHAHYEPFEPFGEPVQGGVARRATVIERIRNEKDNVLLVDAGDAFQGTLFFNKWQGEAASHFMNELGYQAMTVGNHEFDVGPGTLGSFVRAAEFPVVSSNLDVSNEPELAGNIKEHVVLDVGGERIGIIGLTTPDTTFISSPGSNVVFEDPEQAAQDAIKALTDQGVNKIVALTHMGYTEDLDLATTLEGIDVIVGGHSHTLLGPEGEGAYPTVVKGRGGDTVLVVSAQDWGRYLGNLQVTFDAEGRIQSYTGDPVFISEDITPDSEIEAQVNRFAQPIAELKSQVVGEAAVDLVGERQQVRTGETNLGNLIADAMLWQTQGQQTQIAIQNGGGIRASIPEGAVTMGQVLEVLPFGNQIATFGLKGEYVWDALENGVALVEDVKGQFPQVAGLRFTYDPAQPSGSRVTSVEVKQADGTYAPIEMDTIYQVASNNFMRGGGDNYAMFAEHAIDPYDEGAVLADAVADYIQENSPVSPEAEGRIRVATAEEVPPRPQAAPPREEPAAEPQRTAMGGLLTGNAGGAFDTYMMSWPEDQEITLTLRYSPADPVIAEGVGINVYGPSGKVAEGVYTGEHGARTVTFDAEARATYTVQVYNYVPGRTIGFTVEGEGE